MRFSVNQIKNQFTIFDNFNNRSIGYSNNISDAEMIARALNIHTLMSGITDLYSIAKSAMPRKKT